MLEIYVSSLQTDIEKTISEKSQLIEKERLDKLLKRRNPTDRAVSVLSTASVVLRISEITGIPPDKLIFRYDNFGKPFFDCGVHFCISHSFDAFAFAVSDSPVGIDIEKIRPYSDGVAYRVLTEDELIFWKHGTISGLDNFTDKERFFYLWTRKEAYSKYTGKGLFENFSKFSVMPDCIGHEMSTFFINDQYAVSYFFRYKS